MSGAQVLNPALFQLAVPAAVLADDEERLEWLAAMRLCEAVVSDKGALLMPDEDEE